MTLARQLVGSMVVAAVLLAGAATAGSIAGSWPGRPASPPPKLGAGTKGPPPAWIESRTRSWWLAYSSYCWKTTCVDFIPPQNRPDLPTIFVRRGSALRLHLGFRPRELSITVQSGHNRKQTKLRAEPVARFTPSRSGLLTVFARPATAGGDATYVARLRVG
jgi:hypothetical protein